MTIVSPTFSRRKRSSGSIYSVVKRTVRDPVEDFYAQFFGYNRVRPRQIRQTLQSLGSGFIVDPAGYIVTNQHVVERAADLKIHVTTDDGKTYNAHYITGDDKTDLAFIKIDAEGHEYRVCPQCGSNMYRQGRTWTCENCGYSYIE